MICNLCGDFIRYQDVYKGLATYETKYREIKGLETESYEAYQAYEEFSCVKCNKKNKIISNEAEDGEKNEN